jgi:hypothetical protein
VFIDSQVLGALWLGVFVLLDILADMVYLLDYYARSRTGHPSFLSSFTM